MERISELDEEASVLDEEILNQYLCDDDHELKFILSRSLKYKDSILCTKCGKNIAREEISGYYNCSIDDMNYHKKCAGDNGKEDSVYSELTNEYEFSQNESQDNSKIYNR